MSNGIRFTSKVVNEVRTALAQGAITAGLTDYGRKYIKEAVKVQGNQGWGTAYRARNAGPEYGGKGARAAVGHLYGVATALGIMDALKVDSDNGVTYDGIDLWSYVMDIVNVAYCDEPEIFDDACAHGKATAKNHRYHGFDAWKSRQS